MLIGKFKENEYLIPNNSDIDDRWKLISQKAFSNQQGNSADSTLRMTSTSMGYDEELEREVLFKTVIYDKENKWQVEDIAYRRSAIKEQIRILNDISSSVLPEPLDYLEITNNDFSKLGEDIATTEPVLVLDYIPGDVLFKKLSYSNDRSFFYRGEDGNRGDINISMVMRLGIDILVFLQSLYEKGYAYTSLSPEHIILLLDNKPRFVGLGRICPIKNDKYDSKHINFGRQLAGYSAPEMNKKETNFGEGASVKKVLAFNLGAILSRVLLWKSSFNSGELVDGAYNYYSAADVQRKIRGMSKNHGDELDHLLRDLMNPNVQERLSDFDEIEKRLLTIAGEQIERTRKYIIGPISGRVKFADYNKGFGYITDTNMRDYYFRTSAPYAPSYLYEGEAVDFFAAPERERDGYRVTKFYPNVNYPVKPNLPVQTQRTKVVPKPKPEPPKPVPQQPVNTPKPAPQVPKNTPIQEPKNQPSQETVRVEKENNRAGLFVLFGLMIFVALAYYYVNVYIPKLSTDNATTAVKSEEKVEEQIVEQEEYNYIKIIVPEGNVRSGPGTDYDVLGVVHEGEQYIFTGNQDQPSTRVWYEIYLDEEKEETGWVSSLIAEIQE